VSVPLRRLAPLRDRRVAAGRAGSVRAPASGRSRRAWSRNGRKAQASAIATLLGLLLIVSMVANYLGTGLPATMSVNDADHALTVEGQVSRLAALMEDAADADAVGAVLSQPITLGTLGDPPFAAGDGSQVGPLEYVNQSAGTVERPTLTASYEVTGGTTWTSVAPGASFAVELKNTYSPIQIIALDEGAVVYAQPGGVPIFLVDPSLSYTDGTLTLWMPEFLNTIGVEAGTGNAEFSARLVGVRDIDLPAGGISLTGTTSIAITTPYAEAWNATLAGNSSFASDVACEPKSVCQSTSFSLTGSMGTVYVNVTATALAIEVASYGISLS
jgi:hypothetical protein